MTLSGFEPATFRLAAQCLNQQRYRMTHDLHMEMLNSAFSNEKDIYWTGTHAVTTTHRIIDVHYASLVP
jgi:hypothetical protein